MGSRVDGGGVLCCAARAVAGEEKLGGSHPDVARSLSQLGFLLLGALAIRETALGKEHPLVAHPAPQGPLRGGDRRHLPGCLSEPGAPGSRHLRALARAAHPVGKAFAPMH
jgi:hypothetical protein